MKTKHKHNTTQHIIYIYANKLIKHKYNQQYRQNKTHTQQQQQQQTQS